MATLIPLAMGIFVFFVLLRTPNAKKEAKKDLAKINSLLNDQGKIIKGIK